jgi:hypothetical protein
VFLLTVLAGCGRESTNPNIREHESEAKPSLIAEADRQHDFGAVIGRPGRKMVHRYRLANTTRHDVKIVDVINRKTCCGIIRVGTLALRPGDATDVEVTLVVGERFGEVTYETEVVTDLSSDPNLVLRTTATAIPAVRVEEVSPQGGTILIGIGTGEPKRAEFRVFASGTPTEPPVDLGRVELRSTIKVAWVGPKEEGPSDDGLRVETRRFAAWLDPAGTPGERTAEILFQDGKQVLHRHDVSWEVVSPITASPKMIVMRPGERDRRVIIHSRDRRPFRITRIECKAPGIQVRAGNAAALTQTVEVEGVPRPESGQGVVTVFTDHPAQGRVELPFVVIE